MALHYRWRDGNGEPGYDGSRYEEQDDCGYCGAPPIHQHATWSDECLAEDGQCPECGATGLAPIEQPLTKKERDEMLTETRINRVANLMIQAVEVHVNPGLEAERGLLDAARGLDPDAASVLTNLAKGLLLLSGSASEEGESDAKD